MLLVIYWRSVNRTGFRWYHNNKLTILCDWIIIPHNLHRIRGERLFLKTSAKKCVSKVSLYSIQAVKFTKHHVLTVKWSKVDWQDLDSALTMRVNFSHTLLLLSKILLLVQREIMNTRLYIEATMLIVKPASLCNVYCLFVCLGF